MIFPTFLWCFAVICLRITTALYLENGHEDSIRRLLADGYVEIEHVTLHEVNGREKRQIDASHIRHRRSTDGINIEFTAFGETFNVVLNKAPQVLHPKAIIFMNSGNSSIVWNGKRPDSFLAGDVTSHGGSASVSYSDTLLGALALKSHAIHIEEIPRHMRKRDTSSNSVHNLLVARQRRDAWPSNTGDMDILLDEFEDNAVDPDDRYFTDEEVFADDSNWDGDNTDLDSSVDDDGDLISRGISKRNRDKSVGRRQVAPFELVAEIAVYFEKTFVSRLPKDHARRVEATLVKWSGVAFEFGRSDQLGHNLQIQIKLMQFFDENPPWLSDNPYQKMGKILTAFVRADKTPLKVDLSYLQLGFKPRLTWFGGLAYMGGMCRSGATDCYYWITDYYATTHEIGHTVGMPHDSGTDCDKSTFGIMGGGSSGFSPCVAARFKRYLTKPHAKCLWTKNVQDSEIENILQNNYPNPELPAQTNTPDEICSQLFGPGYTRRKIPKAAVCRRLRQCYQADKTKKDYGYIPMAPVFFSGEYCGDGKVCLSLYCRTWKEAQLGDNLEVRKGGWSKWSEWSECSRTCGGGLITRQRKCDNPKPKNSPTCEGEEFQGQKCGETPCQEDDGKTTWQLLHERATELCTSLVNNGVLDKNTYDGKGLANTICLARCRRHDGKYNTLGFLSDGSKCVDGRNQWTKRCMASYCSTVQ